MNIYIICIEDDYDSEFCYETAPVAALQALSPNHVIYLGTFNKVFFPTFHLGYMVMPEHLIDAFSAIQTRHVRGPSQVTQKALADFMKEGHVSAYIRKMCRIYQTRRDALIDLLQSELGNLISISGTDSGLHLVAHLPKKFDDVKLAHAVSKHGIVVNPLSCYYADAKTITNPGLVLGFGNINQRDIVRLGKKLCEIIHLRCKSL